MQPSKNSEVVALLKHTIQERQLLEDLPVALRPNTLEDAYAIQISLATQCGGVKGWKVAPPKPDRAPVCSALPSILIASAPHTMSWENLPQPKFEVELAVRLRADVDGEPGRITRQHVENAIGSVHPAIEIIRPRFLDGDGVSQYSSLADLQKCGGVVVGEEKVGWRELDFAKIRMSLNFDQDVAGTADGGPDIDIVLDTLVWLANHAAHYNSPLKAGQVIITGARVKPVALDTPNVTVRAEVEGFAPLLLHVTD